MARLHTILTLCLLAASGAHAQDLPALATAAKKASRDADAQSLYGLALVQAGQYKKAERVLKAASRLRKDDARGLYDRVALPLAQGNHKRARGACNELKREHPQSVLGEVCMARAFLAWRRASRAEEHLRLAIEREPTHVEVLLVTADVRRVQGKRAEAAAAYQKVLQAAPTMARAHRGLGLLHLTAGDRDAARKALELAVEHAPYDITALLELGRLQSGTQAVATLERALALEKKWPEAELALAQAKLDAGDAKGAEALFRRVLKDKRLATRAQIGLGMALLASGDLAGAEEHLKAGLAAMPHSPDASFALAQLYEKTERYEDAFDQYRAASATHSHNKRALLTAARLAVRLERKVLALAFLRKALERAPRAGDVHALYADLLAARGDRDAARSHYEQALAGEGEIDRAAVAGKLAALK